MYSQSSLRSNRKTGKRGRKSADGRGRGGMGFPRVFYPLPGLRLGCDARYLQGYSVFSSWIVGHRGRKSQGEGTRQSNHAD